MEHVWVFLVLALIVSSAQALIIAEAHYLRKRMKRVESMLVWFSERETDVVVSMDAHMRERYDTARAARRITIRGEE